MFHSIRWRLMTSYVLLILVTVGAIGFIAQWAVKNYTEQQTTNSMKANAESIALQAQSLMVPKPSIDELAQIAHAASQFGNLQVRIYNRNRQLLVDSGLPGGSNEITWFVLPSRNIEILPGIHTDRLIIGMPILRQPALNGERIPFLEQLPSNTPLTIIRRVEEPWGYSLFLQRTNWHNVLPHEEMGTVIDDADRSDQIITVPIGERKDPLGYVELSNSLNFEAEALSTSRRALLIAGSIAIVFAVIMGLVMGKRLSRPITNLTETTRIMSSGDLAVRASIGGNDEIGELAYQFNHMAEQLQTSFEQLETERDTLTRFIADAAHELRTPITALKNFNTLLQGIAEDDEQARIEFLEESQVQLNRLTWITNNLLDLSRLESGLADLEIEQYDVDDLINTTVTPMQAIAEEKGLELTINSSSSQMYVSCDKLWIETALTNLLDNAIKFTPAGGQIGVGSVQNENEVQIWVKDTGRGIPEDELPFIFNRFYRSKDSQERGSGLGLSIVESVVKAHGGSVSVESVLDEGSMFTIKLPISL